MKRYRIFTEDKNAEAIEKLVGEYFSGFTIYRGGVGFWLGQREANLTIEILTDEAFAHTYVKQIARQICLCNDQQAVMVETTFNLNVDFFTKES